MVINESMILSMSQMISTIAFSVGIVFFLVGYLSVGFVLH